MLDSRLQTEEHPLAALLTPADIGGAAAVATRPARFFIVHVWIPVLGQHPVFVGLTPKLLAIT